MSRRYLTSSLPLLVLLTSACAGVPMKLDYDMAKDAGSWKTGFADYPVGAEASYELRGEVAQRPKETGSGLSVLLSGNNHSDDLFMFMKRKVTGLEPSKRYQVEFLVELASNAAPGQVGTGGPPGEAVWVKAGMTAAEPQAIVVDGYNRMNVDKGNQANPGPDAVVLGNIAKVGKDPVYEVIRRDNAKRAMEVTSAADGSMWVLVGTDSGFESTTSLYYLRVEATLTPLP